MRNAITYHILGRFDMRNSLIKIMVLVMTISILMTTAAFADNGSTAASFSDVKSGQWTVDLS